jgi:hypothetical protein
MILNASSRKTVIFSIRVGINCLNSDMMSDCTEGPNTEAENLMKKQARY